jgi:hypothetical protein
LLIRSGDTFNPNGAYFLFFFTGPPANLDALFAALVPLPEHLGKSVAALFLVPPSLFL